MGPLLESKDNEESQALEERSHSSWEPHSVPASQSDISSAISNQLNFSLYRGGSLVFKALLAHGIIWFPHQHSRAFIQELEEVKADIG